MCLFAVFFFALFRLFSCLFAPFVLLCSQVVFLRSRRFFSLLALGGLGLCVLLCVGVCLCLWLGWGLFFMLVWVLDFMFVRARPCPCGGCLCRCSCLRWSEYLVRAYTCSDNAVMLGTFLDLARLWRSALRCARLCVAYALKCLIARLSPQAPYTAACNPPPPPYGTQPGVPSLYLSLVAKNNKNNCATENVETAGGDPFIVGDVGSLQSILEDYLEVDRYQVRWGQGLTALKNENGSF